MQAHILYYFRTITKTPQKQLADVFGKSQPYYSQLESGKRKMNDTDAEKLAHFYGISK